MSKPIIEAKGLGKKYALSHLAGSERARYGSLRDTLAQGARSLLGAWRGKSESTSTSLEEFWALRDVSFEVERGEVIGIIGRNGAGKSTLLKILSRITEPTSGEVRLGGRVASLLEVGTGFHPELTGRENVFLNGTILGMSRTEIGRKFEEIVAFAEVERFLDTPVKRYSSGMYMRLAFAVAAHLEPEILVVDEVLAVGDAAFQKKCLGKMGEAAKGGRTVLFVSHNMQAVSQLTASVILLERGRVVYDGSTAEGIAKYSAESFSNQKVGQAYAAEPNRNGIHLSAARVITSDPHGEHVWGNSIQFEFKIKVGQRRDGICFAFQIIDEAERPVCHFWLQNRCDDFGKSAGEFRVTCSVPKLRLYMGRYTLKTYVADRRAVDLLDVVSDICPFEITMRGIHREQYDWTPGATVYLEDGEWSPVTLEV
jgi:lipopolysaccharide transport system ATP-binding protein